MYTFDANELNANFSSKIDVRCFWTAIWLVFGFLFL